MTSLRAVREISSYGEKCNCCSLLGESKQITWDLMDAGEPNN